jgi:F0F1-type ATP synthase membrane subunit a
LVRQLDPLQPWWDFREELQCATLGTLFVFVGVANFVTTVLTLIEKRREKRRHGIRLENSSNDSAEVAVTASIAAVVAAVAAAIVFARSSGADLSSVTNKFIKA